MTSQAAQSRIYHYFDQASSSSSLGDTCRELVTHEMRCWPEYSQACEALLYVRTRTIECEGFSVRLIFNPGRSVNTSASVTPEHILERPCFLCPGNLPDAQKAIEYRNDFLILVNPRPIVPCHLTIAHKEHYPQSISGNIGVFLDITADLGQNFTALYNGPRCGASAPDHLHFQAAPSIEVRLEEHINRLESFTLPDSPFSGNDVRTLRGVNLGREVILIESDKPDVMVEAFTFCMKGLDTANPVPEAGTQEPMVNIAATYSANIWKLFVFPRRVHRPSLFYRPPREQILVSPAVMEMAGTIITPREHDFDTIDARMITQIYREVSAFPYSTH